MIVDFRAKQGVAPKGRAVVVLKPGLIPKPCFITLLTSLGTDNTVAYWTTRSGTNTIHDFINTIQSFIESEALQRGDILVMDNASVHTGDVDNAQLILAEILDQVGIELKLLPTYSPELNPCEFVFARIKNYMRSPRAIRRDPTTGSEVTRDFEELLVSAVERISVESMEDTYKHCRTLDLEGLVAERLRDLDLIA